MSANFSSDSIVWVDGQVTLPKHILKILGIENGHRSNVNFQRFPTLDAKKLVNAPKMSAHHRGICHF